MKLYKVVLGFDAKNAPEDMEFHVVAESMADIERVYASVDEIKLIDDMVTIIHEKKKKDK